MRAKGRKFPFIHAFFGKDRRTAGTSRHETQVYNLLAVSEVNDEAPSEQASEQYRVNSHGSSARGRLPWLILLVVSKVCALFLQLYVVRQYTNILGDAGYGTYLFVFALGTYMTLLDPGASEAFLRQLSALHPVDQFEDRLRVQRCHVFLVYTIAGIVTLAAIGLSFVLTIPRTNYSIAERQQIFLSLAFYVPWGIVTMIPNVVLYSLESFKTSSFFSLFYVFASPILCLIGIRAYHSPAMIFYGLGVTGMLMFIFQSIQASREFGASVIIPKWNKQAFDDAKGLIWRDAPNRYTSLIANSIDKVLVGFKSGVSDTGALGLSGRLPEALTDALAPLVGVVAPQLYRESELDPEKFTKTVSSYFRINIAMGICLMLVPCSAGSAFLHLWLGPSAPKSGGAIMLGMALYRVAVFFISAFAGVLFAIGKPNWSFPLNLTNAVATAALTVPALALFGLLGIGYMNAFIGISLIGGATYVSKRVLPKQFQLRETFMKILFMLIIGVGMAFAGYALTNYTVVSEHPFIAIILAGVLTFITAGMIFGLRLADVPESIAEKLKLPKRRAS